MNEQTDPRDTLHALVKKQQEKEWPLGDWITPLQDIMNNGSLFSQIAKNMPLPMAIYDRNGTVEMANDILLKETELTDEDIKSGKVNILDTGSMEFNDAVFMALKMETNVVNGLKHPLDTFLRPGSMAEPSEYKAAIVFPYWDDGPTLRGVALFLPREL